MMVKLKDEKRRKDAATVAEPRRRGLATPMIEFWLPLQQRQQLKAVANWHGIDAEPMARRIVLAYLRDRRRLLKPIGGVLAGPAGLPASLGLVVERRLMVLARWDRLLKARAGQRTKAAITRQFVGQLTREGMTICARTLYSWRNNFRRAGNAGLIDHRSWKPYARPASGSRQANAGSPLKGASNSVQ